MGQSKSRVSQLGIRKKKHMVQTYPHVVIIKTKTGKDLPGLPQTFPQYVENRLPLLCSVIHVMFGAMLPIDAIAVHRVSFSFVGGAEDTLKFPACSEVGLDTAFVEGAF